jgi:tetratricopeptide (TPR) repeat protein
MKATKGTKAAPDPLQQALAHYQQGRYIEANQVLGEALRAQPRDPRLWHLAGTTAQAMGKRDGAEQCWRRAISLAPDYIEAYYNLGLLMQLDGKLDEAVVIYRDGLRQAPEHARTLNNLGTTLMQLDRTEEARPCFERAIAIDPRYDKAHRNLGRAYAHLGRLEEAQRVLQHAAEITPEQERAQCYRTLAYYCEFTADDRALPGMEALAQKIDTLAPKQRMELHFALGKAYSDLGQRERSFGHFRSGNAEKRRLEPYREGAELARLERIRRAYTAELMAARRGHGQAGAAPIFVVGMPRSGSTLVEQILASVPGLHGAGECDEFGRLAAAVRQVSGAPLLPDGIAGVADESLQQLGAAYVQRMQVRTQQSGRISDKSLRNFLLVGLIHLALPQAKIIHCRRDPVDTCLSCYSHLFDGDHPYAYDLAELGRYWRAYDWLMAHWREVLPPGVMLELRYEELVGDLEGQSRRMLEHCGLPWTSACLEFHKNQRAVHTASLVQVRQPLYRSSVQKWRAYGELLRPLLDALGDAVPPAPP